MKHYKSVAFLSTFRMSSPPAVTQNPPIENFLATVLDLTLVRNEKADEINVFFCS